MTSLGETFVAQKSQWVSFKDDATLQGQDIVDKSRKPSKLFPEYEKVQARAKGPGTPDIKSKSRPDPPEVEPSPPKPDVFCWVQFDETPQAIPPAMCLTGSKKSTWKSPERSSSRLTQLHSQSSTEVFYEDSSTSIGAPCADWSATHTDDTSENASGSGSAGTRQCR